MADSAIYREFVLRGPAVWHALVVFVRANVAALKERGRCLRVIVTEDFRPRHSEQNKRYWKMLAIIAEQAWINGRQFDRETWHVHFAKTFLALREVVCPDGEIVTERTSTTTLSVAEFSEYMDKIEAVAASDLGVVFDDEIGGRG